MRIPITIYPKHICILNKDFKKFFPKLNLKEVHIIKDFPQNNIKLTDLKQDWLAIFLSEYKRTNTYTSTPTHITMSQADAKNMGYRQGQKVDFHIPYKNIILNNIKIKIKDYYLPDLFILKHEANRLDIVDGDWWIIST